MQRLFKHILLQCFLLMAAHGAMAQITTNYFGTGSPSAIARSGIEYIDVNTRIKYKQITIPQGNTYTQSGTLSINYDNGSYTTIDSKHFNDRQNLFSNSALSISVTAGHYIEFRCVYPSPWTTPATNVSWSGYVTIAY